LFGSILSAGGFIALFVERFKKGRKKINIDEK